jgi:hypothetical protein
LTAPQEDRGENRGESKGEDSSAAKQSALSSEPDNTQGGNIVETAGTAIAHTRTLELQLRQETVLEMCRRIAEGESLKKIGQDPDMPSRGTFLRWCHEDAEIGQMYVIALRLRAAGHAEELEEDMAELDKCTEAYEVAALKVKINTRQWIMSRLLPKQYGDHQIIEHTGEVKLDEKQVDARLQHLVARIKAVN